MTLTPELSAALSGLSLAQKISLRQEAERLLSTRRLFEYRPYAKQREFHAAGRDHRERLFLAGNQLGKTISGGAEVAMHLTGHYPDWWQGRRFDKPIVAWAAGVTGETTRDTVQRILFGRIGEMGTGWIPAADIVDKPSRAMGVSDLFDTAQVRHVSGGTSHLAFKFYEKGREKWQAETLDLVWFDEEPPEEIYSEGLTRTNATGGMVMITATPLLGMTEVVRKFYPVPTTPDRSLTKMTIDDAEHYTPEERARIIAAYPAHEQEARAKGIPMLGEGRIFPVPQEMVSVQPFKPPYWWPYIGGLDFGWDHPFAAVKCTYDPDGDVLYVMQALRVRQQTPLQHCVSLAPWGKWVPFSWPRDGLQHDKGNGQQLAQQYRTGGLFLLSEPASYEGERGVSVEAGIADMLDRMLTGRLKVFSNLVEWFDEFLAYHRKDRKVVKEYDDLLSATRYALMMVRYAQNQPLENVPRAAPQPYNPFAHV